MGSSACVPAFPAHCKHCYVHGYVGPCMQACAFNDQVCQYRCIVSYETPQFSAFSLCIVQKHNCRSLSAEIPMRPGAGCVWGMSVCMCVSEA